MSILDVVGVCWQALGELLLAVQFIFILRAHMLTSLSKNSLNTSSPTLIIAGPTIARKYCPNVLIKCLGPLWEAGMHRLYVGLISASPLPHT